VVKLAAISHLASTDAPTGAEKSLAFLAESLAARGHEIAVIAPGPWCFADRLEEAGIEVAEITSRACWLVQSRHQPVLKQALRYLRWRLPDPGKRRMMIWLDRCWPDVVYVNCLPQLKGAAAARALGLPVVWHIREILPPGRRRWWFARRLACNATRIVAVSDAVAQWLCEEGLGDLVTVIRNGCVTPLEAPDQSTVRAEFGLPAVGVLVGFFAQIVRHKGAVDLVRACSRVMADNSSLRVVFAGDGPLKELSCLRNAISASGHSDRFIMLPPQGDVERLQAAVDMVAVPSRWPDPLPRSVMEAMAAGRPVVAYRTGGIPEMIVDGETGFMVETGDVEGLAQVIGRLVGDSGLRQRLGVEAARRARNEFSFESHVDQMERLLVECAADGSD